MTKTQTPAVMSSLQEFPVSSAEALALMQGRIRQWERIGEYAWAWGDWRIFYSRTGVVYWLCPFPSTQRYGPFPSLIRAMMHAKDIEG